MIEANSNPIPGQFFVAAWMNFSLLYFFLLASVGPQPADLYIRHDDVLVTLVHNKIRNEEFLVLVADADFCLHFPSLGLAMVGNSLRNLVVPMDPVGVNRRHS
jgi:hypothetical protein